MSSEVPGLVPGEDIQQVDSDFYRYVFLYHPLPAWIYDVETLAFLAVNRAAIVEYGYSEDEFLGMDITGIRSAQDAEILRAFLRGPVGSPENTGPWRHRRKDGSSLTVTIYSHDLIFKGRTARLLIINDISQRRQMEQDLRLFAAAVAGASEAVMITDSDWENSPRIVFVNAAFSSMTGFTSAEALGRSPCILHGPKTEPVSQAQMVADLADRGAATYETVHYRRNRTEFICEAHVSALRDEAGNVTHYLSLQHDVTERNRLQEQFQQAQKMDAIGRLAGGIAHDFNNLLTIILGYAGLLSSDLTREENGADKQIRSLNEIQKAAEKAAALTGQLLAFSRKQVLRTRVIVLNPVISHLEGMLRRLIGEDIDLEMSLEDNLGRVEADPGQVEQALMNLAVNARDAMPRGGMLTIETRNVEITARSAPIIPLDPGRYVLLVMTDTGHGMDEATRSRVFEPFFTTKEPGRGTGLGLAMVYGFVKQSGGWIGVFSEPGHGACFQMYLPRTDSRAEIECEQKAVVTPRGSGTILVVEDEIGIRELVREVLTDAGYAVHTAPNAERAIEVAERHDTPIDLLLSDVVLPGTSGPDLALRLKASQPGLRVLFASGYSDHALLRQGTMAHGAAFVQKPFDTDTLLGVISQVMRSEASSKQAS